MPDLSNLLGAVYGDGASSSDRDPEDEAHVEREPAASERGPKVPDWADDDHLDAAFAEWKPGPATDASPAEHAFVQDTDDSPPPLADDLAAALSEALVAASGTTADPVVEDETGKAPFDFSTSVDDDGPAAAPTSLSKFEIAPLEDAETEQSHGLGEVDERPAPEPEPEPEVEPVALLPEPDPEPEPEPIVVEHTPEPVAAEPEAEPEDDDEDQPEVNTWGSVTSQRAAAAELTAASRIEPDRVVAEPTPTPAPEPVAAASAPLTASEAPTQPIATAPPEATTALPGSRQWDRSEDDILPEKPAKKFFSLSLRRG